MPLLHPVGKLPIAWAKNNLEIDVRMISGEPSALANLESFGLDIA